jgi:hypothetical protein
MIFSLFSQSISRIGDSGLKFIRKTCGQGCEAIL